MTKIFAALGTTNISESLDFGFIYANLDQILTISSTKDTNQKVALMAVTICLQIHYINLLQSKPHR